MRRSFRVELLRELRSSLSKKHVNLSTITKDFVERSNNGETCFMTCKMFSHETGMISFH